MKLVYPWHGTIAVPIGFFQDLSATLLPCVHWADACIIGLLAWAADNTPGCFSVDGEPLVILESPF